MIRRNITLVIVFLLTLTIAFFLRDVVERTIITPLFYLWWVLKLYYFSIPQYVLWIILILATFFSAASSLIPEMKVGKPIKPDPVIIHGQVADLANWLIKSRRGGIYYKWLLANRLGKTAREILAQRDGYAVSKKFGRLNGRDWYPPQEIEVYLETGLNGSFAEFPQPRRWENPPPTPLDIDPQQVINYLENEMETSHAGNRKSI